MEMDNEEDTSSFSLAQNVAQRGAGGKFRKPSSRKPPSTPYARPQPQHQQRTRWLSKLVDPACRLISGGATRIFPSLFSKPSECSLPAINNEENQDIMDTEAEENTEDDGVLNHEESRSTGVAGPSLAADRSKNDSDLEGCKQDIRGDITDAGLSEIEQLVKGKTFSRDEINRLIEIIRSRAVDVPDQEKKYLTTPVKGDAERPIAVLENPRKSIEEKQEDLSKALLGPSTTLLQSSVEGKVGASPIEIAKAYMGNRASELGLGSKSILSKDEIETLNDDEFALKPFILAPSPKPSTCWPGAMLHDQRSYLTPRSERGRFGLHNFPRTPYSRSIFSKSKTKLTQGNGNRGLNTSTPLQHLQTPIYEQSRRKALDNGHGSVGPVRRIRHRVLDESPARGYINSNSSLNGPLRVGNNSISEGFFPVVKNNLELGGTGNSSIFQSVDWKSPSSELGVPPVHPHSSQMARTILEHLERNPPTPKDKSAELRLATSWNKTQLSNSSIAMPSECNTFLHLGGLDPKKAELGNKKNSVQVNEARMNSFFKVPPQENAKEPKIAVHKASSASVKNVGSVLTLQQGGTAGTSQNFRTTQDSEMKSKNENDLETIPNAADGKVLNLQKKPPSHPVGTKPVLASITVGKPEQKWTFSSDNSTGFSFPVTTSAGVLSEPPTPSIMPSLAASGETKSKEGPAVPSYSFSLNRTTTRLIFAFPSTSIAPTSADASDLKFNFGSDKTRRISFSSIGKDAICY